jgi:integrase
MGSIVKRTRKDGSVGYTARVQIHKDGKMVLSQSQTFDRPAVAKVWIEKKEKEFAAGVSSVPVRTLTVSQAIDRYVKESRHDLGKTKIQVLRSIKDYEIAEMNCADVQSKDVVSFASELGQGDRKLQTVLNYLSHLDSVLSTARIAWGIAIPREMIPDAMDGCKKLGLVAKSSSRERLPIREELTALHEDFKTRRGLPMDKVLVFAVFSARRHEEITRILWSDLEPGRILVRDMKNPGQKIGNNVWTVLPPEAEAMISSMPKMAPDIFPFTTDTIGAGFTRSCKILGIDDLHIHDLRHMAASRLLMMGWTIPQAATVTGHRSWQSLQRHSHLRATGDPLAYWP